MERKDGEGGPQSRECLWFYWNLWESHHNSRWGRLSMWGPHPLWRDSLCGPARPHVPGAHVSLTQCNKRLSPHCWWCSVAQSCLTLCDPRDQSPSGFSVHGIFQARILEWVSISSSRGSSWPRNRTCVSWIAGGFSTCWAIRKAHLTNKTQSCSPRTPDGWKLKKKIHMQCKGIPLLLY